MTFAVTGVVVGAVAVGSSIYSADQQRKAVHSQMDAMRAAQEADARQAAEAVTGAATTANAELADAKRRRRASALGMGDQTLGSATGASSVLASGAAGGSAVQAQPKTSVLGGGAV